MENAILDENRVPTIIAVSNADGISTINLCANPITHTLCVDASTSGPATGIIDPRDENRKVAFMAVSSDDGVTPIPIYANALTNKLLIKST